MKWSPRRASWTARPVWRRMVSWRNCAGVTSASFTPGRASGMISLIVRASERGTPV
ncbi:hypothetical protein [Streptomyces flavalbus]|uniref:Uncharacterized protein n=1 Tax=Streptomyces flavalbus TaxID=2665155 RepID=A0ABW2WFE2_9ACTN